MKLSLGTAQFGSNYGVKGGVKVEEGEVRKILRVCQSNGIESLDTATLYGDSEKILGLCNVENFKVVTKIPAISHSSSPTEMLEAHLAESLKRLGVKKLDGLLLHSSDDLMTKKGEMVFNALEKTKPRRVAKVGVSVYCPEVLQSILNHYPIDLVQIPYNPIDSRWDDLILTMSKLGTEIHVRSIFLQGLLLMRKAELPKYFKQWEVQLDGWFDWVDASKVSGIGNCLNYANQNEDIEKVVVGVDSSEQLLEIIGLVEAERRISFPKALQVDDPGLLNPANWQIN
ncbi:aldo/keto reductase [Pseudomonadales bacterium]|nr:aldo/keto reductase [Pseudomonadales bacterium]